VRIERRVRPAGQGRHRHRALADLTTHTSGAMAGLIAQLVRYAGHEIADGVVIGDPANADLTELARDVDWRGGRPV
jgi:nitric oxide synthase oxygenase domain/subunit